MDALKGYKTYLVIGLAAILWAAAGMGFVPEGMATQGYQVLGMLGGVTVAAKINRLRS